jgi:putative ubiquitin-RnfH superfamily antitoxin RatB of RatAB toxin-antitoxin module
MESKPVIEVTVCFSAAARQVSQQQVQLPAGSHLADAIRASGLLADMPDAEVDALQTGVWCRKLAADHVLRDGDRVELYRSLKVDPKVARRARFTRQGAGTTGLFSKRRAGAKSGY